jgi:undecaprenyl-diphosphatase
MLSSRNRSAFLALALLLGAAGLMVAVGRTAPASAPATWLGVIGEWDDSVNARIPDVRTSTLFDVADVLDLIGSSIVLVPLRIGILVLLAAMRRFSAFFAFAITWAVTQPATEGLKSWLHRGRPPNPLVDISSFAMPSGHVVALTSIAVAVAIALATGWWRGGLVLLGFLAGAAMGVSRLLLQVHWLSDVVVGLLFGGGVAIASAVVVDAFAKSMPERIPVRRGRG